jgi:N-acetylmuramoyl-L-alanine amidase
VQIKLCIDPGHGLGNIRPDVYDPGAVSGGVTEADVVLQYALAIKFVFAQKLASARSVDKALFLTRDESSDVTPVGKRDDKARAAGCTHFVSLHLNAGGGHGTETFFRDDADKRLATAVHRGVTDGLESRDRGVKHERESARRRLAVLDFRGPACLVELGFIDSASDREKLLRRSSRLVVAESLWETFLALEGD